MSKDATMTRRLIMPLRLTPAMRAAAVKVRPPITSAEKPYIDALYEALLEVVRREQQTNNPATADMRTR